MGWGVAGSGKSGEERLAELSYVPKHTKSQGKKQAVISQPLL